MLAAAAAVIGGWSLGFLRRLAGWVGAGIGIALAIFLTPILIRRLSLPSDTAVFVISGSVFVLLTSAGQALGSKVGSKAYSGVHTPLVRRLDSLGGSMLGIFGVAVLAWLLVPVMGGASGWPSESARGSTIAGLVDDYLPRPPSQITEIERQLSGGEFPKIFAGLKPAPKVSAPPVDSPLSTEQVRATTRSVVRIEAPACGRIQSGSGFFVGDGLVVTNAHVVAGSRRVSLTDASGADHAAEVIHFDPTVDLAVLSTSFKRPALALEEPEVGNAGLVMGFPGGGNLDPSPFVLEKEMKARGFDIYDKNLVTRDLLVLASRLQPGDSGSAVVRKDGSVVGVAVAIAPDNETVAYAISVDTLRTTLAATDSSVASTGACT